MDYEKTNYGQDVMALHVKQSKKGIEKYKTPLESSPAGIIERINHISEELMDGLHYAFWIKDWLTQNDMPINAYQQFAERTANRGPDDSTAIRMLNFSLGVAGEAGEFCNLVKKIQFHDHDYDRDKLKDELGDILWYVATLATTIGFTLDEVARFNIEKLKRRYPDGFEPERSKNRENESEGN